MAYKEVHRVEISEVIRRWPAGHSQRRIASGTGLSRDTITKYIAAAEELGVSHEGPEPSEEQISRLAAIGQPGPAPGPAPTAPRRERCPWPGQHRQQTDDAGGLRPSRQRLHRRHRRVAHRRPAGAPGCLVKAHPPWEPSCPASGRPAPFRTVGLC